MSSESALKRLKDVDLETQIVVHGYNRRITHTLAGCNLFENIPPIINSLCILYYLNPEYFAIAGKGVQLSTDKMTISSTKDTPFGNTSYGLQFISSTEAVKCRWSIKVNETLTRKMTIGISSNDEFDKAYTRWRRIGTYTGYKHYGYNGYVGCITSINGATKYGQEYGKNDVVHVELDLLNKEVTFYKNEVSQGVAFNNIAIGESIKYRLAIQMSDENTSLTLIKFVKHKIAQ